MKGPFQRLISDQIIDFINDSSSHKNVLVLSGARQVGKTTTLQELLRGRPQVFLNLEKNPSVAEQIDRCQEFRDFSDYLADEHGFNPSRQILVFDEAQMSRRLGSFVRFMKEEWGQATVIITGSVIHELHAETSRRPVGRETFLEMWPMSFKEFLGALEQDSLVRTLKEYQWGEAISLSKHERFLDYYQQYLKVGGLPEVIRFYIEKKDYLKLRQDILKTYEDDFIRYFSLEEVNLFKRCLSAVASNVGSPSKDTQAVALDRPGYKKVAGIFSRLEKWKLIIKCEQLGVTPEKNHYYPKRYLYDVGILNDLRLKGLSELHLQDLSLPALRSPMGGLIENSIAHALKIQFEENLFGIRLPNNTEIDFATKCGDHVIPIECKLSLKFKKNYLSGLKRYLENYSTQRMAILLYGGPPLEEALHDTHIIPYYMTGEIGRLLNS